MRGQAASPQVLADRAVRLFSALQKPQELERLISLALEHVTPNQAIVEIGSDAGGTLWVWRRLVECVIGVDLPHGQFGTGRRLFDWGAQLVRADSHLTSTRTAIEQLLAGREVGLLFIDGDHAYAGVKADYEQYGPLVAIGGLVALHDICEHNRPGVEVARFWRELRDTMPVEEIIHAPTNWGGIGVIHVA